VELTEVVTEVVGHDVIFSREPHMHWWSELVGDAVENAS